MCWDSERWCDMSKVRSVKSLVCGQLSDWAHSPRTIISGLVILALTYMNARDYQHFLERTSLYAYWGESVFYFLSTGFGNLPLTSALFLIMVSEVPKRNAFQNIMLIRSNRGRWYASQVLFCLLVTILMMVVLLSVSLGFSFPALESGEGWSDLERMASESEIEYQLVTAFALELPVPQACWLAAVVLFCFWFVMAFSIFVFNLFGKPQLGLLLYATLLSLKVIVLWEMLSEFDLFMPIDYATVCNIANTQGDFEGVPTIVTVLLVYAAIIAGCLLIGYLKCRYMDLQFDSEKV